MSMATSVKPRTWARLRLRTSRLHWRAVDENRDLSSGTRDRDTSCHSGR